MHNVASPSIQPDSRPVMSDGFVVEVGGRFVCEFPSLTAALKAGLELKARDAGAQVKVYDAKERLLDQILDRVTV